MEVRKELKVSAEEFFQVLATSVAYDVSQATGKTVSESQLYSGYRYEKKMKNKVRREGDVDVVITQFVSPVCYEARFTSSQGTNVISYQMETTEQGNTMVHYQEGFEGSTASKSLNYRLVSWMYERNARKRISNMLEAMEHHINGQKSS